MKTSEYKFLFSQYIAEINRLTENSPIKYGYTYARGKSCQIHARQKTDAKLLNWQAFDSAKQMLKGLETMVFFLNNSNQKTK